MGFSSGEYGGSFTSAQLVNHNNGASPSTISVVNGAIVIGVSSVDARLIDEPNVFFNVGTNGSLHLSSLNYQSYADDTNIVVTITDNGDFTTDVFDKNNNVTARADRYINFATDNLAASWTWTGKVQSDFEALWATGTLRHNGGNIGVFADNFTISGSTISPAAPPSVTVLNG